MLATIVRRNPSTTVCHVLFAFLLLVLTTSSVVVVAAAAATAGWISATTKSSRIRTMPASASPERSSVATTVTTTDHHHHLYPGRPMPRLPLPPPICSNVVGTWAYDTMSRRVNREILEGTVMQDCAEDLHKPEFAPILRQIHVLRDELSRAATTRLTPLDPPPPPSSNDESNTERIQEWNEWNTILSPYSRQNDTWLTAPWMVTEFYVYRRMMQCFDYWNVSSAGYYYDPFSTAKRNGLLSSVGSAEPALQKLQNLVDRNNNIHNNNNSTDTTREGFILATQLALWGNKMDLSLWPADVSASNVDIFTDILQAAKMNLLHDDTAVLADYCLPTQLQRHNKNTTGGGSGDGHVDIIVDNAGFELVTDLALAQYLIESKIAKVVTFQLKSHPTFVSDALEKDLIETVRYYADDLDAAKYPACVAAGRQWRQLLQSNQWQCREHNFWVQPWAMWDMPEPLRKDFANRCDLVFVKGDANYRRLLGDRTWDGTADSFADVVGCYFPAPVCALRTLKAEIACGMDAAQIERAKALDPQHWMTSGRFGVVQFGKGAASAVQ